MTAVERAGRRAETARRYKGWGALGPQEGDAVASRKTVEDVLRCSARRAGLPVRRPASELEETKPVLADSCSVRTLASPSVSR